MGSSFAECCAQLGSLAQLNLDLHLQLSELLETSYDVIADDVCNASKAETFLWPDIFSKWNNVNTLFKDLLEACKSSQIMLSSTFSVPHSHVKLFKLGSLWRSAVTGFNASMFLLESFLVSIFKHASLQWAKDFSNLPLFEHLLASITLYNEASTFVQTSPSKFHFQPIISSGRSDSMSCSVSKWDSRESRLRNLQINGVCGRPSQIPMNLVRLLNIIAAKRAQGAVLAMTWSLSPFMQCETTTDLDSFGLLVKECDGMVTDTALLDQTNEVVQFQPLKEFMEEERASLGTFIEDVARVDGGFVLQKGSNGRSKVGRFKLFSMWLHHAQTMWKLVSASVGDILLFDTRWATYHLPLVTKPQNFAEHLQKVLLEVHARVQSFILDEVDDDLNRAADNARQKSLLAALYDLTETVYTFSVSKKLDELYLDAQLLLHQNATEMDASGIHHVIAGEKGIHFFNPFVFAKKIEEETMPQTYTLLQTLTAVGEVYSWAVEIHLWDSLTSWSIVKYLDISQHSLPMISDKLMHLNPLEKLDDKTLPADCVSGKIWAFWLRTTELRFKAVIEELRDTKEFSFAMFVKSCGRICFSATEELMPKGNAWKKQHRAPRGASTYVPPLVVAVLQPVIDALRNLSDASQSLIGQEIVKALCHSMLEVILKNELKFNFFGAMQLQQDFVCIRTWIHSYRVLSEVAKEEITANDVFLECEGVTRLLMRQRDWFSAVGRNQVGPARRGSTACAGNIPPEMYVIHQHLWLGLRLLITFCQVYAHTLRRRREKMNVTQVKHLKEVAQAYEYVVDDVLSKCTPMLVDENIDPNLMKDLKQIWVRKIRESGAVPYYGLTPEKVAIQIKIAREDGTARPTIPILVPVYAKEKSPQQLRDEIAALGDVIRRDNIPDNRAKVLIEDRIDEVFPQLDGHYDSSSDSDSDPDAPAAKRNKLSPAFLPVRRRRSSRLLLLSLRLLLLVLHLGPLGYRGELSLLLDRQHLDTMFEADTVCVCQYTSVEEKKKTHDWHLRFCAP
ncbi:unnamed protein product [Notodromas monacha]|uniref:Coiled-coil protein 142 C-terminal domain-containing protein n=1 Tax=Notodromas monacha TaxID=399045 RepID=A0A7R9GD83_9CRUS|nr:unnamed protein product [Notodromas monacha]CAG0916654.1 unnamed protein product [Notodromas monacha]